MRNEKWLFDWDIVIWYFVGLKLKTDYKLLIGLGASATDIFK